MIFNFCTILISPPASVGWGIYRNKNNDKSMNNETPQPATGASETTRFFCTRISSAASAAGELKQHRKEPNMAKRENEGKKEKKQKKERKERKRENNTGVYI